MINSILEDIKMQFRQGNMLTRIIMLNVFVFVLIRILIAVTGFSNGGSVGAGHPIMEWLAIPSNLIELIKKPWTIVTHMFLHYGFWHILWNMLWLYWFARIIGDFLGDRRVLPLYLLGGFVGVIFYLIADHLLPMGSNGNGMAYGASAASMAFVVAAATLSPDYEIRLLLLGSIKIKYIAAFKIVMDIIQTSGPNSGGHFGHLGGAFLGFLFISYLRQGTDITLPLQRLFYADLRSQKPRSVQKKKSPIKVVYKNTERKNQQPSEKNFEARLDMILEKINKEGIDKLTKEEKAFLDAASKKD